MRFSQHIAKEAKPPMVANASSSVNAAASSRLRHQSDIDREGFRSLAEGMKVTYEEESGEKGPKAVRVKPV